MQSAFSQYAQFGFKKGVPKRTKKLLCNITGLDEASSTSHILTEAQRITHTVIFDDAGMMDLECVESCVVLCIAIRNSGYFARDALYTNSSRAQRRAKLFGSYDDVRKTLANKPKARMSTLHYVLAEVLDLTLAPVNVCK
eukprot:TRINITY_DN1286_c0_g1_i2.p1 TRINITY_DN1286_c0_g1~~TRINITY_DN1286_c0_g1_i2.p1  ORF type:complete len:140 (+),score=7.41 TRINITY_DN1286_c0_g1_i2:270-689(+)